MRTNSFLQELQATFFLSDSEQFLCSPLIRSKSSNLSDEISDELVVLGQFTLALAGLHSQVVLGALVTLLKSNTNFVPWCHYFSCRSESSNISSALPARSRRWTATPACATPTASTSAAPSPAR